MRMKYHIAQAHAKCRICSGTIQKGIWCLMFEGIHVSPHEINLFFHDGCFMRALDWAMEHINEEAQP